MSTAKCVAKVITVLTLAGMAFGAGETRKDMHFKVGKRPIVTINNPYGPVVVKAGAAHEVVVTAILHSDKVELDQSQSHNRIDIVSHLLLGADQNSGMIEYQITIPAEANLTLHSDTGRVMGVTQAGQRLGFVEAIADLPVEARGLGVAGDGLGVVGAAVVDAVPESLAVAALLCLGPADVVEGDGFSCTMSRQAVQLEGLPAVGEGLGVRVLTAERVAA